MKPDAHLGGRENFAIPGDGDVHPLYGESAGSYRMRVGKWRVFFRIQGTQILAHQIDNRGEAD